MQEKEFLEFIAATTARGGCTFNLKTSNCSKKAREVLTDTPFRALAKQHISGNVKNAYYNNAKFKQKLDDVMQELNITVIA